MRGEFNAHAGLREGARRTPAAPKPEPRRLPVLTVVKLVSVAVAVAVVLEAVLRAAT